MSSFNTLEPEKFVHVGIICQISIIYVTWWKCMIIFKP